MLKLDLNRLEGFDYVHIIEGTDKDGKPARLFFKGSRSFFFEMSTIIAQGQKDAEGFAKLSTDFKKMNEMLVSIMVGWENIKDNTGELDVQFSKKTALQLIELYDFLMPGDVVKIISEVYNQVAQRESLLKNSPAVSTSTEDQNQGG